MESKKEKKAQKILNPGFVAKQPFPLSLSAWDMTLFGMCFQFSGCTLIQRARRGWERGGGGSIETFRLNNVKI